MITDIEIHTWLALEAEVYSFHPIDFVLRSFESFERRSRDRSERFAGPLAQDLGRVGVFREFE